MTTTIIQAQDFSLHREGCQDLKRAGGDHYTHGTFETKEELFQELLRWEIDEMGAPNDDITRSAIRGMLEENLKPCAKLK